MIITALFGGLGNQMFQYASGKALALRNRTSLKVDCQYFDPLFLTKAKATIREYELPVFALEVKKASLCCVNLYAPFISLKTKNSFAINKVFNPLYISEKRKFFYQTLPSRKFVYLYGYWQSWRYFRDFEMDIRNDFKFLKPVKDQNLEILNQIRTSMAISVHVRLGDFGNINTLPSGYYSKAIDLMNQKYPDATFFVFSDEPHCASKYFTGLNFVLVNGNAGLNSYIDMQLMSQCKHHIIANSSFSWWGAWLNGQPNKIVVAPSVWYDNNTDTSDILPPDWIRL